MRSAISKSGGNSSLAGKRELSQSFLGRLVGLSALHEALQTMDVKAAECVEAGRWIVAPSARGANLGRNLLLSLWVMGRWLGKRYLFGAVGVREGQVKMLARYGGQTVPAIAPIFVEEYDDELSVMYLDLHHPPPGVATQLEAVERLLGLRGVVNGAPAQNASFSHEARRVDLSTGAGG